MDLKKIKNSNHLYGITKDVSEEQWQEWLVCHCLQRTNVKGLGGSTGSTVLVWMNWELLVLKSELCSLLNLKLNFAKCWWYLRALKLICSRIHPWPWAVFCSTVWHMTQVLKNRYNEAAGFFLSPDLLLSGGPSEKWTSSRTHVQRPSAWSAYSL